jgi:signal transduction histidine kinase
MTGDSSALRRQGAAWALDVALAVASALWAVALTREIARGLGSQAGTAAIVIGLIHGGSVVVRRHLPRTLIVALVVTAVAYRIVGLPPWFLGPASLIGLYTVAVRTPRATSVPSAVLMLLALVGGAIGMSPGWDSIALYCAIGIGAWVLGDLVRRRQTEAAEHAARAQQLEVATEELARFAVTEERLRIARELHDIVAHSMSVVALNAGAARVAAAQNPAAATAALETIEATSRSALAEMRHLLHVLRDERGAASIAPLPGLAELPQLVTRTADAGVAVDVSVQGDAQNIPSGVDLAGYRIIQEALTNVLRHSTASTAQVSVHYGHDCLELSVTDGGPARAGTAHAGGSGLIGMRERVMLYGGDLASGPTPSGGFAVRASLPLPGGDR